MSRFAVFAQVAASSGSLTIQDSAPSPTFTLYDADGAAISGMNGVAVTGHDSGAMPSPRIWYTLDASNVPKGAYRYEFKFRATGSDALERVYEPRLPLMLYWSDVAGTIRASHRLAKTVDELPDQIIDAMFESQLRRFSQLYPDLPAYGNLTGADRYEIDEGIGLIIAARLRPNLPKGAALGELTQIRTKSTSFVFDSLTRARVKDIDTTENSWLTEAWEVLGRVGAIRTAIDALRTDFKMFQPAGRRRAAEGKGLYENRTNPLYNLVVEELMLPPGLVYGTYWVPA